MEIFILDDEIGPGRIREFAGSLQKTDRLFPIINNMEFTAAAVGSQRLAHEADIGRVVLDQQDLHRTRAAGEWIENCNPPVQVVAFPFAGTLMHA